MSLLFNVKLIKNLEITE